MSDNNNQESRESGQNRRSRSRSGQNNRSNNQSGKNRSQGRQAGGGRRTSSGSGPKNRQGGYNKSSRRPMPAPAVLTWWQKLLKAVGLYKESVRPPRPERRVDKSSQKSEPRRRKTRESSEENRSQKSRPPRNRDNRRDSTANPRGGDPSTVESRRVYIGNLSYEATESDLEDLFKGIGPVRRVEIIYNRATHRSKGYAFIEMLDIEEAKRTVEVLHEQFFMGRKLTVSGAKTKDHSAAEEEDDRNTRENSVVPKLASTSPDRQTASASPEVNASVDSIPEPVKVAKDDEVPIPNEEFNSTPAETPQK